MPGFQVSESFRQVWVIAAKDTNLFEILLEKAFSLQLVQFPELICKISQPLNDSIEMLKVVEIKENLLKVE